MVLNSESSGSDLNENGGLVNGHGQHYNALRNTTVDDHFAFFKAICERANEYYVVQKARGTYDATKHSWGFLERTLDKVEGRMQEAAQYTAPLYESYVFPAANRMLGVYQNVYSKGMETSKNAVDRTKTTAVTAGTLGLGIALVATQMGLIAGTAATNLFIDGLIATKNAGGAVISKTQSVEQLAVQYIQSGIQVTRELLNQPKEKATEHANAFLDISNAVFERLLNLESVNEDPESSLSQRVANLARRIGTGIKAQASHNIVEPCQRQLHTVVEQLQKGLVLVEYVKKQKQWTFQQAGQLSHSVNELRTKVETEAKLALTTPEDALLRSIRHSSGKLNEVLLKLRLSSAEILNESMQNKFGSAIAYVEQLDLSFVKAGNIYQVKDEVLEEAMKKLSEITQWTSSLVNKNGATSSQNGETESTSSVDNGQLYD